MKKRKGETKENEVKVRGKRKHKEEEKVRNWKTMETKKKRLRNNGREGGGRENWKNQDGRAKGEEDRGRKR